MPSERSATGHPGHANHPGHPGHANHTRRRTRLTKSKLAGGHSPIYELAAEFQNYMHLPDPSPLYAMLGTVAAAMLQGPPVWVMIVAAQGSGKTMLLNSIIRLPGIHLPGTIEGVASLLSGTRKKEREKNASGGLLRALGKRGMLVWPEFTGQIQLPPDALKAVFTAFREMFDGQYRRPIGTDGGSVMWWPGPGVESRGRIGVIGGVTPHIDQAIHAINSTMGDRLLYFRTDIGGGVTEAISALRDSDDEDALEARQAMIENFFSGLGMSILAPLPRRKLTLGEMSWLASIGEIAARARSSVPRSGYNHEIVDMPTIEPAPRIAVTLGQLYVALDHIGLDEEDIKPLLKKIGFDSIPRLRTAIIRELSSDDPKRAATITTIARKIRCAETTTERCLRDLEMLELVVQEHSKWRLSEWAEDKYKGL